MRLSTLLLGSAAAGTAVAFGSSLPQEAVPRVHADTCNEIPKEITRTDSWTLATGIQGTGLFCAWFFPTLNIATEARTTKAIATDQFIGAKSRIFDRCNPNEAYQFVVDTGWIKAGPGSTEIWTGFAGGTYQDCGQQEEHQYFGQSAHWFTNSNPPMDEVHEDIKVFF